MRSGFPNDYALAIADSAAETSTSRMLYVQIPSAFRSAWGLQSNPSLMGRQLDVTGALSAYFSHPGMTSTTRLRVQRDVDEHPTADEHDDQPRPAPTGPYDSTYYAAAIGKTGSALQTALHRSSRAAVTTLTYDQVWTALKDTDQDPTNTNNVIELYSGRSIAKSDNGGGVDDWNREHVWAKSHGDFGTVNGPGTDVHHLRPEDVTVNCTRGNLDFDNGGSAVAQCTGCLQRRRLVRAARRGQGRRRPDDLLHGGPLRRRRRLRRPRARTTRSATAPRPYIGKLSVLKQWNLQDPPDAFEKRRNQVIYDTWQHNRNPFIDHPEWVTAIYGS